MSAFFGLVIFVFAYESARWLAIKGWRAVRASRALNREELERIDRHARMDAYYQRWCAPQQPPLPPPFGFATEPWEQPPAEEWARCMNCGNAMPGTTVQHGTHMFCGRPCADAYLNWMKL